MISNPTFLALVWNQELKSGDASFKLSLRYRLYNAWFYGAFKWWREKLLAFGLKIISKLDSYILMTVCSH